MAKHTAKNATVKVNGVTFQAESVEARGPMTEAEWMTSDDPVAMLEHVRGKVSDRKLRMFVDEGGCETCAQQRVGHTPAAAALYFATASCPGPARKAALLREAVGNPFREVWLQCHDLGLAKTTGGEFASLRSVESRRDRPVIVYRRWLTPDARALAQTIYDDRDWELMPILADCLESAGCDSEDILGHLRRPLSCVWCGGTGKLHRPMIKGGPCSGPEKRYVVAPPDAVEFPCGFCAGGRAGPHVRGCWALDCILGKE